MKKRQNEIQNKAAICQHWQPRNVFLSSINQRGIQFLKPVVLLNPLMSKTAVFLPQSDYYSTLPAQLLSLSQKHFLASKCLHSLFIMWPHMQFRFVYVPFQKCYSWEKRSATDLLLEIQLLCFLSLLRFRKMLHKIILVVEDLVPKYFSCLALASKSDFLWTQEEKKKLIALLFGYLKVLKMTSLYFSKYC